MSRARARRVAAAILALASSILAGAGLAADTTPPAQDSGAFVAVSTQGRASLDRADALARASLWPEAVEAYARILTSPPFLVETAPGVFRGGHAACLERLLALPPEGREAYLRAFETAARTLLPGEIREQPAARLEEVVRRFPLTSAAREAAVTLAARAWERGDGRVAAAWVRRHARLSSERDPAADALAGEMDALSIAPDATQETGAARFDPGSDRWSVPIPRPPFPVPADEEYTSRGLTPPLHHGIAADARRAYAAGPSGIHAWDLADGSRAWSTTRVTGGRALPASPPAIACDGDLVVVVHEGRLVAMDARTGKVRWTDPPGDPADGPNASAPAIWGGLVLALRYTGGDRGEGSSELCARDAATGRLRWSVLLARHYGASPFRGGTLAPAPAAIGDVVIACDGLGQMAAVDPCDGAVRWLRTLPREDVSADAGRAAPSPLPVPRMGADDSLLLVPPGGTRLLSVRRDDGETLSATPLDGATWVLLEGEGAALVSRTRCRILDLPSAAVRADWEFDAPLAGAPAIHGDALWTPHADGIRAYALADGAIAATRRWLSPPDGQPVLVAAPGTLLAVGPRGAVAIGTWEEGWGLATTPISRARLQWSRGRIDEAIAELEAAAPPAPGGGDEARDLLGAAYALRGARGGPGAAEDLSRAADLLRDAQSLVEVASSLGRVRLAAGDARGAAAAWLSARRRLLGARVRIGRQILPAEAVAGWWLRRLCANDDAARLLLEEEAERAVAAPSSPEPLPAGTPVPEQTLREAILLYPETAVAAGARLELAGRLRERQLFEEALVLLPPTLPPGLPAGVASSWHETRAGLLLACGLPAQARAESLLARAPDGAPPRPPDDLPPPLAPPARIAWARALLDVPGGRGRWLGASAVLEGDEIVRLDPGHGTALWRSEVGEEARGAETGGSLLFVWSDWQVLALDAATGEPRWLFEVPGAQEEEEGSSGAPVTLHAGTSGTLRLQRSMAGPGRTPVRIDETLAVDGTLLVRADGDRLLAVRESDGRFLWQRETLPTVPLADALAAGSLLLPGDVPFAPPLRVAPASGRATPIDRCPPPRRFVRAGETILVVSDGRLTALARGSPDRILWEKPIDRLARLWCSAASRTVALELPGADAGATLDVLDGADGTTLWRAPLPAATVDLRMGPDAIVLVEGPWAVATLTAFDARTGERRWSSTLRQPAPCRTWADGGDTLWIWEGGAHEGGRIVSLDGRTGRSAALFPLPGTRLDALVRLPDGLLAATDRVLARISPSATEALQDRLLAAHEMPDDDPAPGSALFLAEALLGLGDDAGGLALLDAIGSSELDPACRAALATGWREIASLRAPPSAVAVRFRRPATADGRLDEPDWLAHRSIDLSGPASLREIPGDAAEPADPVPFRARAYLGWDDGFLYLAVEVEDGVHVNLEEDGFARGDGILLAIDGDHSGGYELPPPTDRLIGIGMRNPPANPPPPDQIPPGDYEVDRRADGRATVYEAAIPWSYFGGADSSPRETRIGLNLAVSDDDGTGVRRVRTWNVGIPLSFFRGDPASHAAFAPALFGDVTFGE